MRNGYIDTGIRSFGRVKFLWEISVRYLTYSTREVSLHVVLPHDSGHTSVNVFTRVMTIPEMFRIRNGIKKMIRFSVSNKILQTRTFQEIGKQIRASLEFKEWIYERLDTYVEKKYINPTDLGIADMVKRCCSAAQTVADNFQQVQAAVDVSFGAIVTYGTALASLDRWAEEQNKFNKTNSK